MDPNKIPCPYCGSIGMSVKFPCCGYMCLKCGKNFFEEDIEETEKK